jgi:hypothetical protein
MPDAVAALDRQNSTPFSDVAGRIPVAHIVDDVVNLAYVPPT